MQPPRCLRSVLICLSRLIFYPSPEPYCPPSKHTTSQSPDLFYNFQPLLLPWFYICTWQDPNPSSVFNSNILDFFFKARSNFTSSVFPENTLLVILWQLLHILSHALVVLKIFHLFPNCKLLIDRDSVWCLYDFLVCKVLSYVISFLTLNAKGCYFNIIT